MAYTTFSFGMNGWGDVKLRPLFRELSPVIKRLSDVLSLTAFQHEHIYGWESNIPIGSLLGPIRLWRVE